MTRKQYDDLQDELDNPSTSVERKKEILEAQIQHLDDAGLGIARDMKTMTLDKLKRA